MRCFRRRCPRPSQPLPSTTSLRPPEPESESPRLDCPILTREAIPSMRKLSLALGGWLMSMLPLSVASAAEDPSPAELLSRLMPPPTPAVGFEDRRSLADFIRRSTNEKDVAVRALGLSNLGRADINGDHCLTHREYSLYLAMWKRWKSSPRAEMVQTIEDYRSFEPKMTDEVMSYTTRLLRQSSSVGEMQLLKQRILLL